MRIAPFLIPVFLLAPACTMRQPPESGSDRGEILSATVRLEQERSPGSVSTETRPHSPWEARRFPALHDREVLPHYPPEAVAARVPGASVRVDFIVDASGLPRDVRASLDESTPMYDRFASACVEAVKRWRFSPSWRLDTTDPDPGFPFLLLETRASLVFRFDLKVHGAGGEVGVSFEADP